MFTFSKQFNLNGSDNIEKIAKGAAVYFPVSQYILHNQSRSHLTNLALLGRLGALSETPLSFCRALAGSSEIPPGTSPSRLSESQNQVGASMGKTRKEKKKRKIPL